MLCIKKFKIILLVFIIIAGTLFFTSCSVKDRTDMSKYNSYTYIASKSSKKFHTRDCFLGKRISLEDAAFFNSRSEAISAGYKPDTVCEP
jgi:hypothetical protein